MPTPRENWKAAKVKAETEAKRLDKANKAAPTKAKKNKSDDDVGLLADKSAKNQAALLKKLKFAADLGPMLDAVGKAKGDYDKGHKSILRAIDAVTSYSATVGKAQSENGLNPDVAEILEEALRGILAVLRTQAKVQSRQRAEALLSDAPTGKTKKVGGEEYMQIGSVVDVRPIVILELANVVPRLRNRAVAEILGLKSINLTVEINDKKLLAMIAKHDSPQLREEMWTAANLDLAIKDIDAAIMLVDTSDTEKAVEEILDAVEDARVDAVTRAFKKAHTLHREVKEIRNYRIKKAAKVVQTVGVTSVTIALGFTTGVAAILSIAKAAVTLLDMAVQEAKSTQELVREIEEEATALFEGLTKNEGKLTALANRAQEVARETLNGVLLGIPAMNTVSRTVQKLTTANHNNNVVHVSLNKLANKLDRMLTQGEELMRAIKSARDLHPSKAEAATEALSSIEEKTERMIEKIGAGNEALARLRQEVARVAEMVQPLLDKTDAGLVLNTLTKLAGVAVGGQMSGAITDVLDGLKLVHDDLLLVTDVATLVKDNVKDLLPG